MKEVFSLQQAILVTLRYFDIFGFALTREEVAEYLYGWSAPKESVFEALSLLTGVDSRHGFFFLSGREELAECRLEQKKTEARLWNTVKRFSWVFAMCPFARMVSVCNSLALGNVKVTSDIDLFVVTAEGRLSACRFFMKLLTQIFGIRAHHEKTAGRFCLSFFVDETAMDLEETAHEFDPHLAYFVRTMEPIFGKKTYGEFLAANESWTLQYFRRSFVPRTSKIRRHATASFLRVFMELFLRICGNTVEQRCEQWLVRREAEYRKKFSRNPGVRIRKNMFKFHENDPREDIAKKFMEV